MAPGGISMTSRPLLGSLSMARCPPGVYGRVAPLLWLPCADHRPVEQPRTMSRLQLIPTASCRSSDDHNHYQFKA
ncbi:hypothetical protein B0H21DRAFT_881880, partial [Amylocystis lapponica]